MARSVPVRDARDIRNLDDVAGAAQDTVRYRPFRPCRCGVRAHRIELLGVFLLGNIIFLPLLRLQILLLAPLLDPKPPQEEDNHGHEHDSANHSSCYCANVRLVAFGRGVGVCDANHVRAVVAVLGNERADLAFGAVRTCWGLVRWALHTSLEDVPHRPLDFGVHAVSHGGG